MTELTWASHSNAALRARMAEYLGRGFRVVSLDERSARLTRRSRSSRGAWILLYPLVALAFGRKREDVVVLTVMDGDVVLATTG
jgi:hypothetical protein